jgi:hypothetical protein
MQASDSDIQPWLFLVEPYKGESISHFLGRFRRENALTSTMLGKETGLGAVISRWEKFRFNPRPSQEELEALAGVVQVDVSRLREMLPPDGVGMRLEPIRLCGACYSETPCHKMEWQLKTTEFCQKHRLTLLSECPSCGARFKFPSLWSDGWCHRCFTPFENMSESQKKI